MLDFRCTIKVSPCITKCFENFTLQVSELVSKIKQHFSDEPPGTVRRVVIYCDGSCDCNDRYLSVGVEKLKEIEKSMGNNSKKFIKTKTELLFGNDRGDHINLGRESENESRVSNMQTNELIPKSALQGEKNPQTSIPIESGIENVKMRKKLRKPKSKLQGEKNPQTSIPIESGIENAKLKVMVDMLVQGKLDETPTENGLVDEKQAKNTKSATHEEPSPPTQDMIDENYKKNEERNQDNQLNGNKKENSKNLKSDEIVAEKIHEKQAQNTESAKDEQPSPPAQDVIDRNYEENKKRNQDDQLKENGLGGNEKNNLKSDEIEIEIEWTEDGEHTAYRADSRTESERWSEGDLRPRTSSQLEYQRFVNEFANFSVEWI